MVTKGDKRLVVLEELNPQVFDASPEIVGKPIIGFLDEFAGIEAERFLTVVKTA